MADNGIRIVREGFFDGNRFIRSGSTVRSNHPLVKKYPDKFCDKDYVDYEWPERE